MSQTERRARMKRMRRVVRKENVFWWVDSFLKAGAHLAAHAARATRPGGVGKLTTAARK
jgi:trehalose-6-phosphate synthase